MAAQQDNITLGPVLCGTLVCNNLAEIVSAYTEYLGVTVCEEGQIDSLVADAWGLPALARKPYVLMANQFGDPWVRFIEQPGCDISKPISTLGWMSLEVLVDDVYALAEKFKDSPFTIIGDPKPLDVSDGIEAFQATGPAGEVLYLTRVLREVPPFDLPMPRCEVDRLFIPVLLVADRDESMALYAQLSNSKPLAFDTKVTVINNALGRNVDERMPIASIQFSEQTFIEIDEVKSLPMRPVTSCGLPSGIAMVSFLVDSLEAVDLPALGTVIQSETALYQGRKSALYLGTAGELIELIER
ncbi:hypothetical protein [Alteromonas lipolytica]|uniref:VOC domain-containing protein n=1 Tax=Alteromonas lipolytica TaxID=1856405 RepID=A0A1E8FBM0_9ALTE|nr:hypothetical protein [Alteromonas lipolytica]OFI33305.1 hypothetical protein BFC17_03325 [Alteromonas lipolytica]GGF60832.1 hypothetical protein GCM10011338_11370 [Alteromonas lipolytica]